MTGVETAGCVTGAVRLKTMRCELVFNQAVSKAEVLLETEPAVMEKLACDDPAGTATTAGPVSVALLVNKVTLIPPGGAG